MSMLNTPISLGQRIESARKAKGLTQDELAERSECSRRTIIKLEQGANVATHTLFRALASLGMSMDIMDKRTDFRSLRELQEQTE
ncbi:helix-turn-helix transcriptional regulator [Pseudomonas fluorescens]|uniref:helix-turn-helix domain-containing protein n=1 Tax=Pseudomonas fluorescens TaxID=294 RepID=UPI00193091DF|nr:helix-turn-helix transcriptional regulator [Pseudomonas fluorescens]MBD8089036.1 helix-turn-helix transcriptional regulator [Pseudomonas fluorescens]